MVDGYVVVAGDHRFSAVKSLSMPTVDAIVMDAADMATELATIDENLCRAELTPTQEAEHLARRKVIWEAMQAAESGTSCPTLPTIGRGNTQFATETADATGQSKRDINRKTRRATEVCQEARDLICGTKLDKGTFLDRLAKSGLSPREQVDRVKEALAELADSEQRDLEARRLVQKPKV